MANRIYFANQQISFRRDAGTSWTAAHGVQSAAVTTTFNLEQAFELGQLAIYENIEGVPAIEVTMTKVLDGYPLLYTLATQAKAGHDHKPTLAGRSNEKCLVALGIWPDTQDQAEGTPTSQMEMSGLFASSVSYSFPLEDNFTEDITLVGNDKGWKNIGSLNIDAVGCANPGWAMVDATGAFSSVADTPVGTGGVNRRENIAFAATSGYLSSAHTGFDFTRLPNEIPGVDTFGWMNTTNSANTVHLSNLTVSTDLGREELFELGTRQPYARIVTFPIEVTCDIEMISLSGDMINAFSDGCQGAADVGTSAYACTGTTNNLTDQTIRIATCEGTRIFLGDKNKLASVNYGGGDAGGGNVTVSYSYTTFNDFTVMHAADPDASGVAWWNIRTGVGYLQNAGPAGWDGDGYRPDGNP